MAALADVLPEMLVLCDDTGVILEVSRTLEHRFGYTRDELLGRNIFEFIHPDDADYVALSLEARLADEGPGLPVEVRAVARDGSVILCEAVGQDLRHVDGVGGVLGSLRDVSRRPALVDSPVRLRAMVNSSSDITLLVDSDGGVRYASQALTRLLGRDADRIVGSSWLAMFHPDDMEEAQQALLGLHGPEERRRSWRARLMHADGTVRVFDLKADDQLDDPVVAGAIVSARDATELQEAESRFDDLFDDAPIGMALLGDAGRVVRANDALARLLHLEPGAFDGRPFGEIAGRPAALAIRDLLDARARGESRPRVEERITRADGSEGWVSIVVSAVRDVSGTTRRALAQIEDITDRRDRERELQEENEALTLRAHFDQVTGLPNRVGFDDALAGALSRSQDEGLSLMFCDLDGFKEINDRSGHEAGDRVLAVVADRLRSAVRGADVVARHGGDEFLILCEGLTDEVVLRQLAARVIGGVGAPMLLGHSEAGVGISVGIARSTDGRVSAAALVALADEAMYKAKSEAAGVAVLLDVPSPG
jgi:diguanylate cyclase (GGDEF)-like protein/PAS domain S-box-containing protein